MEMAGTPLFLFLFFISHCNSEWTMSLLSTYDSGLVDGAEIGAFHSSSARVFVANGALSRVDVLHLDENGDISFLRFVNVTGGPASVAVGDDVLAVALAGTDKLKEGKIAVFDISSSDAERLVIELNVGVQPDCVYFSPDATFLLSANEGTPDDYISISEDPLGSISVVTIPNPIDDLTQDHVTTLDFTMYDNGTPLPNGLRLSGPEGLNISQDIEPEYIAISKDSTTAYITLQENNAIATVNLAVPEITNVYSIPLVDHANVPFDASDKDNKINIQLWPNVYGIPQPDAIAYAEINGIEYVVIANEGDAKGYEGYYSDIVRVNEINASRFDSSVFDVAVIQANETLGRLHVSTATQDLPETDISSLYHFGSRSFSILFAENGSRVFDSGSTFEDITAAALPEIFNCGDDDLQFDLRSADKGPEPETVVIGIIDGEHYAFITLERIGGVAMYNIENPQEPKLETYFNNRNLTFLDGDLDPEGLVFVNADDSPTGEVLLIVTAAVTGHTSVYLVKKSMSDEEPSCGGEECAENENSPESEVMDSNPDTNASGVSSKKLGFSALLALICISFHY